MTHGPGETSGGPPCWGDIRAPVRCWVGGLSMVRQLKALSGPPLLFLGLAVKLLIVLPPKGCVTLLGYLVSLSRNFLVCK